MVRAVLGEQAPKRLPKGTLREIAWKALTIAYEAGEQGIKREWGYRYGGISQSTWFRLEDYNNGEVPLIKEVYHPEDADSRGPGAYRVHITSFGRTYYEQNWERYRALYPDVKAMPPQGEGQK